MPYCSTSSVKMIIEITDATIDIITAFRDRESANREVRLLSGPRRGHAANFLSMLCHPELPPGPVALSDQDDVWLPGKLRLALNALHNAGPVALYGAQSHHTDRQLRVIGRSRLPRRAPCFRNALTQNVVSGHSAVLSAGALTARTTRTRLTNSGFESTFGEDYLASRRGWTSEAAVCDTRTGPTAVAASFQLASVLPQIFSPASVTAYDADHISDPSTDTVARSPSHESILTNVSDTSTYS